MRPRLLFIGGLVLLGIAGIALYSSREDAGPSASIQLAGYELRSNSVLATIVLTNTGTSALSFRDGAGGTYCEVTGHMAGIETNFYSGGAPFSMSWAEVVRPSASARTIVLLPKGIELWHCRISVWASSPRERAATRMMELGIWNRIPASRWFLVLFPNHEIPYHDIQSPTFQVVTNT